METLLSFLIFARFHIQGNQGNRPPFVQPKSVIDPEDSQRRTGCVRTHQRLMPIPSKSDASFLDLKSHFDQFRDQYDA
ncbi:hypothetical protein ACS0TY_025333 [Phlomoides rotata]